MHGFSHSKATEKSIFPSLSAFSFSGSVCTGCGTLPIQWCKHDRLQDSQHWEQSGGFYHREVVHGATAGSTKTWFWFAGWLHDREFGQNKWMFDEWINPSFQKWYYYCWSTFLLQMWSADYQSCLVVMEKKAVKGLNLNNR